MKSIMFPVDDALAEKLGRAAKRAGWTKARFNRLALSLVSEEFLNAPNEQLGNWLSNMLSNDSDDLTPKPVTASNPVGEV